MELKNGICITLIVVLLTICYFSPNYREYFENITPPPIEPIPLLTKNQSAIINGYQNSIIRPDITPSFSDPEPCTYPCYTDSKFQKYCNTEDAVNYYGVRVLITPEQYDSMIQKLFDTIVEPGNSVTNIMNKPLTPTIYCDVSNPHEDYDDKSRIMNWLMDRIALGVTQIPELNNNGPWKSERFFHTDSEVYSFITSDKDHVYNVLFNLYNPLRSTSTAVEAIIVEENQGIARLVKMNTVNQKDNPDAPRGFDWGQSETIQTTEFPEWNYMNTLDVKEFNQFGFYNPPTNIQINSGIPPEFEGKMHFQTSGSYLEPCQQYQLEQEKNGTSKTTIRTI